MQRYQPALEWIDNDAFAHAAEDPDGDFVLYADAQSAIDAAARENAWLRAVVEAAREVHRVFFVNTDGELRFVSLESATATVCRLDDALSALDAKGVE
jgi:hypothetical protein